MNKNALISIIVPVYNVDKYLSKCIDSIISQTYNEIELILVDDGSPDNSPKICDEYARKDNRIIVIHKENGGVSSARNAGLDIAKGEYIGFIDPDDYIVSDMYECMVNAIEKYNFDMVVCGYDYIDENGNVTRPYKIKSDEILTQKQFVSMQFDMPPTVRHGVVNKLFRKSLFSGIRFPENMHSSEDVYVICSYVKKISDCVFIHKPLYKNLVRNGSATHGGLSVESLALSFKAHNKMHTEAISLYPDLKNHSIAFLLDVCTLKYNEAKSKVAAMDEPEKKKYRCYLNDMKSFIKKYAWRGLLNGEIYWKTRISYILIK